MKRCLLRLCCSLALACLPATARDSGADFPLALRDDSGQLIHMTRPAQRIVSLAPHITETLYAAGAGEQVIGTVSYSDYPAAAERIPRVGSYDRVNLEVLVARQPDLVIAWLEGNGPAVIERIRGLGIPVYVSDPTALGDIADSLRAFGQLSGNADRGEVQAAAFEARLGQLQRTYQQRRAVSVFYQVWDKPLLTINDHTLIADVIRLCGGENIFADAPAAHPVTNVESVLTLDPQVILASGMGEERPEWLDAWRAWPTLSAVQGEHLYFIVPEILQRHSTRILDGAEQLCAYLEQARG